MSESTCDKMLVDDHTIYQLHPHQRFNRIWATVYSDTNNYVEVTDAAKRLAACWNACEGLDTAFLESNKFLDCSSTHRMAAQRDQLLAALNSLILFTKPAKFNAVALNHAHQTIAAVTDGKEPVANPAEDQRDELLAALEEIIGLVDSLKPNDLIANLQPSEGLRAIIAKAKGGAQ